MFANQDNRYNFYLSLYTINNKKKNKQTKFEI